MYISYQWLQEYLTLSVSALELADKMSVTGIEIESVKSIGQGLKKLVVGETLSVINHPDSDHLHICQVNVGTEHSENGTLQIVCGAPNVEPHQKVIVALPGARIKDNIKIKKGKIRGQESHGMLCSLEELGFSSQVIPKECANGIYILPDDAPIGEDIIRYLCLDDTVLELSITPNRADALSVYGTAYEVGAIYNQQPQIPLKSAHKIEDCASQYIQVDVENSKNCSAYYMSIIKDVTVQPSPLWLQMKLMSVGVRPINNVVDVTNYMLMLYGQPLHAFDYHTLPNKHVVVRDAKPQETIVTLDAVSRELDVEDIVITSADKPIALAGIMGGLDTEITENTTIVALEAAVFNAKQIRATSKRLNLRSEASVRFEKGINLSLIQHVLEQASAMIAELSNGKVVTGIQGVNHTNLSPIQVKTSLSKMNRVLGTKLTDDEVTDIFSRLGFDVNSINGEYEVSVPPRRWDISIEADLIEEVARIYGYDNLPSTLPTTPSISGGLSPLRHFLRLSNRLLESFGYTQTIGYSLTSLQKSGILAIENRGETTLALPMSEERSVLRRSLVTGLLDIAAYNIARNCTNLALYETGRVFYATHDNEQPYEEEHIALLLTGNRQQKSWYGKDERVDYYDIKGTLDAYFKGIGVYDKISYQAVQKEQMHPGRTAHIVLDNHIVGYVGQIHPHLAKQYDLPDTYVAELSIDPIQMLEKAKLVQTTVPKYPSMTRDIALLVNEKVEHQDIVRILTQASGKYLSDIQLFDSYSGIGIEPGKKSLAYRLTFLNVEATLVEEDINRAMTNVTDALTSQLDVVIR
ncbi:MULTISPECIES: phenylalanine--tRNA ligase subunit beta [unclassified Granulicatella]|uniref:phenylalanine--tRNA ligase subunit beta n=1 Tax=unclassified Granulicatella TaxID=2630493 RepID=UPI0010747C13|nr:MULTISPECIES: phenylalanine--tRNA ligase subunit beta [unclassified Granulicatella]MBF0779851.1 phenylalanine--tRNA ligase subunit beta [Granulicatella sp. 19428wC4_WM01]TFU96056.1 phenylalanine--tRNA ligase subunit beta [Granulicatella sp. WM01]